jgi:hypothetical protein
MNVKLVLVLLAVFAIGCNDEDDPSGGVGGSGGAAGAGGSGGTGGSGGSGGTGGSGGSGGSDANPVQFIDDEGICRSTEDFHGATVCPATYDEALTLQFVRCGGSPVCAGMCGRWLAAEDFCTFSPGCSYDPDTRELVGVVLRSDTHDYCEFASRDLVLGDGHHDCTYDRLDVDQDCPLVP